MPREWGTRAPNSFEVECGYCHQRFWTAVSQRRYCSDLCAKQAQRKQRREYGKKKSSSRRTKVRREKVEGEITKPPRHERRWDFTKNNELVGSFYDNETANKHLFEDVGDYERVETDLDDILSLFRGGVVYGRFAELRARADPLKEIVAKLNMAVDGVPPKRVQELLRSQSRERIVVEKVPSDLPEPWHGTSNGYRNRRCRCDACRKANNAYMSGYNKRRKRELNEHRRRVNQERNAPNQDP